VIENVKARSTPHASGSFSECKVPSNAFLKPAQLSRFVESHKSELSSDVVHVHKGPPEMPETLSDFRQRYARTSQLRSDGFLSNVKIQADFVRKKGFKYADLIEALDYDAQLKGLLKDSWTKERSHQFVASAKKAPPHDTYSESLQQRLLLDTYDDPLPEGPVEVWSDDEDQLPREQRITRESVVKDPADEPDENSDGNESSVEEPLRESPVPPDVSI
jgi:hypothetical protein